MTAAFHTGWAFPDAALRPLARACGFPPAPPGAARLLIGWSLGGLRALREAAGRTPPPDGVVLLASGARFCADQDGWPGTPPAVLRALQRKLRTEPADALRGFHRLAAGASASEALVESRRRASAAQDLAPGLAELAQLDLRGDLPRLAMPVLLLHGARDRIFPAGVATATAQRLPRATLQIHPEAGHDLPLMQTAWCADRIREWLGGRP